MLIAILSASFRIRAALQLEILALRHQLGVLQRRGRYRPLPLTAALLGLALLAKGLVPLVLALPLLFRVRGRSQPKSAFKGRVPDESGRQAESLPHLRDLLG